MLRQKDYIKSKIIELLDECPADILEAVYFAVKNILGKER